MSNIEPMATPEPRIYLCADLSLRCPGFAILRYEAGVVALESLSHLDLRRSTACHGKLLTAIYDHICALIRENMTFVREKAFSRFPRETQALNKVVGISDLAVWQHANTSFHEIAPATIKKLLTGSGKSDKQTVAKA